jgi:hypothetical protein
MLFEYWRPTRDWVQANLFRLLDAGVGVSVMREGDDKRGAVLIVLAAADGTARVLGHVRTPGGQSQWMPTHNADRLGKDESERLVRAAVARDPDLWVLLIDGDAYARGRGDAHPFRPPVGHRVSVPDAMALRARDILRRSAGEDPERKGREL